MLCTSLPNASRESPERAKYHSPGHHPGAGNRTNPPRSPEGAEYPESGYLALTGLGEYCGISTRGDAPGYGISPFQG